MPRPSAGPRSVSRVPRICAHRMFTIRRPRVPGFSGSTPGGSPTPSSATRSSSRAAGAAAERDGHGARAAFRERVLQRVRQQLVDDQAAGHRRRPCRAPPPRCRRSTATRSESPAQGVAQVRHEVARVVREVDRVGARAVEPLVDEGHRADPALALREQAPGLVVAGGTGLQVEQARDHLQVVLHPVVDFLEQDFLVLRLLGLAHRGDVAHEREHLVRAAGRRAALPGAGRVAEGELEALRGAVLEGVADDTDAPLDDLRGRSATGCAGRSRMFAPTRRFDAGRRGTPAGRRASTMVPARSTRKNRSGIARRNASLRCSIFSRSALERSRESSMPLMAAPR